MATPPHASGNGYYQQRVWKVSKALDRLAVMCEQHHLQTKHVDGLPDWTAPSSLAAGVKTRDDVAAPANFAWGALPPKQTTTTDQEDRFVNATPSVSIVENKHGLPAVATLHEEDGRVDDDADALSKQSELLRASSREMMARLSFSSTESFPLARPGQATQEAVRPLSMPQAGGSVKPTFSATIEKPPVLEMPPQTFKPTSAALQREPKPRGTRSSMNPFSDDFTRASPHQRVTNAQQRRKAVQFADHERNYRGSRAKHSSDLTYHEAMQALAPPASGEAQQKGGTAARSTYQETYQWPRRENLVSLMDKVGGQTAGGPTRYEPRRVFTAADAMRVADESRLEFQSRKETSNQEALNHTPQDADEMKHYARQDMSADASRPVRENFDRRHFQVDSSEVTSVLPGTRPVLDDAIARPDARQPSQARNLHQSTLHGSISFGDDDGHQVGAARNAQSDQPTHDVAVMTTPICLHEASTQTDPLKISRKPSEQSATGICLHCGRNVEQAAVPANNPNRREANAAGSFGAATAGQTLRMKRAAPTNHRHNPIFTNTRFPPEPPVFRGKTTYTSEFGNKRHYKR